MNRRSTLLTALSLAPLALGAASPALAGDKTGTSRKLLREFLDALTAHDMDRFKALYVADGYIQHQALATNAASLSGREAVVTYFAKRIEAFPDLVVTSDVSLVHEDMVCANFHL